MHFCKYTIVADYNRSALKQRKGNSDMNYLRVRLQILPLPNALRAVSTVQYVLLDHGKRGEEMENHQLWTSLDHVDFCRPYRETICSSFGVFFGGYSHSLLVSAPHFPASVG